MGWGAISPPPAHLLWGRVWGHMLDARLSGPHMPGAAPQAGSYGLLSHRSPWLPPPGFFLPVTPSRTLMVFNLDHWWGRKKQEPQVTVLGSNLCQPWAVCLHLVLTPCDRQPRPHTFYPTPSLLTEPRETGNGLKK